MTLYSQNKWELTLAPSWIKEYEDDVHTFYNPEGFGTLQISAYSKTSGLISENDLFELIELDNESLKNLNKLEVGDFQGYQLSYSEDPKFCYNWWLINSELLLFVTYHCEIDDKEKEIAEVFKILNTLNKFT